MTKACRTAAQALFGLALLGAPVLATSSSLRTVELRCDAIYLPARSLWSRVVHIAFDDQRVLGVEVDGLRVYSFRVQGQTIHTALDNERIRIDLEAMLWNSDFRGQASADGRCERQP